MDDVADLFRVRRTVGALDDRTWNDLLMDDVFACLDRAESGVGQQMLYCRLRGECALSSLDAFNALATRAAAEPGLRESTQITLARLGDASAYFVHRLARPDALQPQRWDALLSVWGLAVVTLLLLGIVWPPAMAMGVASFLVNRIILVVVGRRLAGEIAWFRQLGPLLSAAHTLAPWCTEDTAVITGSLGSDLVALQRLSTIARWVVSGDPLATNDSALLIREIFNTLFLLDAQALYFGGRELRKRGPHLLRVIETVGEIDAAIAIASFRVGAGGWSRPAFAPPDARARFIDLRHPLVDQAVPSSIELAPPHGVLVTGSNMSGKSTFLRTVGVNVVLAQTVDTCLAHVYDAPIYRVCSCIGRGDDLLSGKSYYLAEVESVLSLVDASARAEPHLLLFDELFRGTNAVERIAAAVAVLEVLVGGRKPHVVLAATHDSELVELLDAKYIVCHFGDRIGPNGLVFDYRLSPGAATSRNAIALLELNGAPPAVVSRALGLAATLDRQRR